MKELRDATSISYQTTLSTLKTIYNQVKNFVMKEYHKAQALNNYYKRIKQSLILYFHQKFCYALCRFSSLSVIKNDTLKYREIFI